MASAPKINIYSSPIFLYTPMVIPQKMARCTTLSPIISRRLTYFDS